MDRIERHLRYHEFRELFLEELGWDKASGSVPVSYNGSDYAAERIAHKRGLQVFVCRLSRNGIQTRRLLRQVQRHLLKVAHEHLTIFVCDEWPSQVWQWHALREDGTRLRQREHPFRSDRIPQPFLQRMRRMLFSLDEEGHVSLAHALQRTAAVLDTVPDQSVFFRKPWYKDESDRLAHAMRDGVDGARHEFILFHDGLARWAARRFRWVGIEEDELDQVGRLAMLPCSDRYRVESGHAFSTYAVTSVWRNCQRLIPPLIAPCRVNHILFWKFLRWRRAVDRAFARGGREAQRSATETWERRHPDIEKYGRWLSRLFDAVEIDSSSTIRQAVESIPDGAGPIDALSEREVAPLLRRALEALPDRDANIVRARFAFDSDFRTLQEIGDEMGLTKERVRQIETSALVRLREDLAPSFPWLVKPKERSDEKQDADGAEDQDDLTSTGDHDHDLGVGGEQLSLFDGAETMNGGSSANRQAVIQSGPRRHAS